MSADWVWWQWLAFGLFPVPAVAVAALGALAGLYRWPRLYVQHVAFAPAVVLVLILSRLLAPLVILTQRDPCKAPGWAWWIAPLDHDIAGPGADPMALGWWELDGPYKSRPAWVDWVRKTFNIHDTRHWAVRLWQLLRNGGAGAMYRMLGERTDDMLITRQEAPGRTEYLAYRLKDTAGVGGGRIPLQGAKPKAFYLSIERPFMGRTFSLQIGTAKLNHPVAIGARGYAKWVCTPRLRKA